MRLGLLFFKNPFMRTLIRVLGRYMDKISWVLDFIWALNKNWGKLDEANVPLANNRCALAQISGSLVPGRDLHLGARKFEPLHKSVATPYPTGHTDKTLSIYLKHALDLGGYYTCNTYNHNVRRKLVGWITNHNVKPKVLRCQLGYLFTVMRTV